MLDEDDVPVLRTRLPVLSGVVSIFTSVVVVLKFSFDSNLTCELDLSCVVLDSSDAEPLVVVSAIFSPVEMLIDPDVDSTASPVPMLLLR